MSKLGGKRDIQTEFSAEIGRLSQTGISTAPPGNLPEMKGT
jgi:hypothetical protein